VQFAGSLARLRCNKNLINGQGRWMPVVASTADVRQQRSSYSAHQVDDENKDKKGSKNSTTDIHVTLH
jgi:hypothetical protein